MQFECSQCHKPLNLPDAKLPMGKAFSFTCPYCKTKNTAMIPAAGYTSEHPQAAATILPQPSPPVLTEPHPPLEEASPPPQYAAKAPAQPAAPRPAPPTPLRLSDAEGGALPHPGHDEQEDAPDETADERPTALIVFDDPEAAENLVKKLDAIGYRSVIAMNLRDAARQIKFIKFRVMLIQEDYFGSSLSGNHLLRSIQNVDNKIRRGTVVVLISPNLATLDDLTAFALSVDAIINSADIEQISQLLQSSIAQAQKLYSVYEEILAEQGLD